MIPIIYTETIDQIIVQFLNQGPFGQIFLAFISLSFATLLSGLIGYEREYHGHSAGLRTHILVALGSALVMFLSIYGFGAEFGDRDPARLAAQVITGVGFIGAGTIIHNGFDIRGLTTATTLWLVMAIGLASGAGQFLIAIVATLIALFALILLRRFEIFVNRKAPKIYMLIRGNHPVLKKIHETASRVRVTIKAIESQMVDYRGEKLVRITITLLQLNQSRALLYIQEIRDEIEAVDISTSFQAME
jgi:putative Mg2+ transporter-C (MgtC) family protein